MATHDEAVKIFTDAVAQLQRQTFRELYAAWTDAKISGLPDDCANCLIARWLTRQMPDGYHVDVSGG